MCKEWKTSFNDVLMMLFREAIVLRYVWKCNEMEDTISGEEFIKSLIFSTIVYV